MTRPTIKIRRPQRPGRPPRPTTRPTALPQGPRWLTKLLNRKGRVTGGPGEPPQGFVRATTSASEWVVYYCIAKIFNDPPDPRVGPFWGGYNWSYQQAALGGRHNPGGAVVDFVVYTPTDAIGIRLQSEHWHVFAPNSIQSYDTRQRINLARAGNMVVFDLYEQDYIQDPSGQACIVLLKEILGFSERLNPQESGRAVRTRAGRLA